MPSVTKVIRDHGEILEPGDYYAPFNLLYIEEVGQTYNPDTSNATYEDIDVLGYIKLYEGLGSRELHLGENSPLYYIFSGTNENPVLKALPTGKPARKALYDGWVRKGLFANGQHNQRIKLFVPVRVEKHGYTKRGNEVYWNQVCLQNLEKYKYVYQDCIELPDDSGAGVDTPKVTLYKPMTSGGKRRKTMSKKSKKRSCRNKQAQQRV